MEINNVKESDLTEYKVTISEILDNLLTNPHGKAIADKLDISDDFIKDLKIFTSLRISLFKP